MNFGQALELIKTGRMVRVPEWKGYWFRKNGSLWVHTSDGEEFPQEDMSWVNAVIFREDWVQHFTK